MKTIIKYLLILPLIAVTSCLREDFEEVAPCPCEDEKKVMLKLALPYIAPQGPVTRSIGATQENTIQTLDLLAFKVEGGVETFQYWADARKTGEASALTYDATLRVREYPQRLVLVGNAREKIATLIGSRLDGWVDADKEVLLSQLTIDLKGGDRWKAIDAANYSAIPMWGETDPRIITKTTNTISDAPVKMMRMIAKIEVQLDLDKNPGISSRFQLKSVHVYNTNTSGRIIPKPGTEYIKDMIALKASLPASVVKELGPTGYTDFTAPGIPNIAMKGAIYLFETAAGNAGNFLEETCIVVGGIYNGGSEMSYYRLDFFGQDGKTHLDILRNHNYECRIVDVIGPGSPTTEEAFRSKSYNMVANIIPWNEGEISDIVFDGQYMLAVSHDRFDFDEEIHDEFSENNILKITTDYPTGWSATIWADKAGTVFVPNDAVSGNPWLRINPVSGVGDGQPKEVRLSTDANTGAEPRTAYIHIHAGRLTYIVTVVQDKALMTTITVTPDYMALSYKAHYPASESIIVNCTKGGIPNPLTEWTLTSYQPWLTLSLNPDGSGASATVNGTGTQTVYLVAAENTDATIRIAEIFLNSQIPMVTVVQGFPPPVTPEAITVSPKYVTLPYPAQNPASQSLTVTVSNPSTQWTLTSNQSWLWLTLNANGTGGGATVQGTGSQTVYLKPGLNKTNTLRYANIYLNGNFADAVTIVTQNYFNTIGQTGSSVERIYIDPNGGDPKLMLTQDPYNPGARFQFGGVRGWTMKTSGSVGNADYNPTPIGGGWGYDWQPAAIAGYAVVHDLASLRAGKGDPCRLVGYTQAEIKAAIDAGYVPDNQIWRLPDGNQLLGFKDNKTTFPRHGRINENGKFENDDRGYYWSSWQRAGTPTFPLAGYLEVRSSTKLMYSSFQASGMCLPCVSQ